MSDKKKQSCKLTSSQWVVLLLCADKEGNNIPPERGDSGAPTFNADLSRRVGLLLAKKKQIDGMSALAGIEFSEADLNECGMNVDLWKQAAKLRVINTGVGPEGQFFTISPDLATQEFLKMAQRIADNNPIRMTEIIGQQQNGTAAIVAKR